MFSRLRSLFARRPNRGGGPAVIEATADGFVLRPSGGAAVEVPWSAVRRAAAYKRDLVTTDAIMLVLELDAPAPALLELSEEWPGFADLFGGMERALGVSPAWYIEIMLPAFEPTPRVLYERPGASSAPPAGGTPPE
ncbi:MAG: hypothetical protein ACJ8GN_15090 [Longimicrobiaceae bacterium]